MSRQDYVDSREIATKSFEAIIMGFMRIADDENLNYLQSKYPHIWAELQARYNAPGGWLKGEDVARIEMIKGEQNESF